MVGNKCWFETSVGWKQVRVGNKFYLNICFTGNQDSGEKQVLLGNKVWLEPRFNRTSMRFTKLKKKLLRAPTSTARPTSALKKALVSRE